MDATGTGRVVLVHDWLTGMRGGEKCLEVVCRRWPDAPLFTLLHQRGTVGTAIENRPLHCSFLQRIPRISRHYRYWLPFMPLAAAGWRIPACDLIVSFSHCVAKAVQPPFEVPHVCYCFTPMRYAWHMREVYFGQEPSGFIIPSLKRRILASLRRWDQRTADRVTHFVAISRTVQERIQECYGRSSRIIYPPVDTDFYCPRMMPRENYYLVVSAFAPYKRLDLAISACNQLRRRLLIVGTGQHEARLRSLAGPTIEFLGWQTDGTIRDHLRRCKALLFPGEEDFGIVPVEAQATGTPVIAFGRGGATETVIPPGSHKEPTGMLFGEQSVDCLASAIQTFELHASQFSPMAARRQAQRFDQRRFAEELFAYLDAVRTSPSASIPQAA